MHTENIRQDVEAVNNEPFIFIREEPVLETQSSLGIQRTRMRGMIHIEALAPENHGTKEIREYLALSADIFRHHTGVIPEVGYIYVRNVIYNQLSLFESMYSLSITIHYMVDTCK